MKNMGNKALAATTAAVAAYIEESEEIVAIVAAVNSCLEEEVLASRKGAPPEYARRLPARLGAIRIRQLNP
ncbi:MAG: hypothetical protein HYX82_00250 [Chloroflexi bacterium]|nr:hypothetical protein [Chloroflexota bacterium]